MEEKHWFWNTRMYDQLCSLNWSSVTFRFTCTTRWLRYQSKTQFSSVQSLDQLGRRGNMRDDSAEIPFQSLLQDDLVSSSGMGRHVHSLILSIQHFLCQPQHHSTSTVPWRMVLERLSWRVTCPNHACFCLLTVARRRSCGPTRKLILFCTLSLFLCST